MPAQVDDDAAAFLADASHRVIQLRLAVAAHGAEDLARQALRVHAHEHVASVGHVAHHERELFASARELAVSVQREHAEGCRHAGAGDSFHDSLRTPPIGNEILDGDERKSMLAGEALELGAAGHRPVIVDDLDKCTARTQAGQAREIHGGLRVARAGQDATRHGAQREDVPRTVEVARRDVGIHQGAKRGSAIRRRDARGSAMTVVHGHRVGGCHGFGVARDHERQVEAIQSLSGQARADHAAAVANHERQPLGRGVLGRQDEVALVLAVLVVHDDHHRALRHRRECVFHAICLHVRSPGLCRGRRRPRLQAAIANDQTLCSEAPRD